MTFRRLCGLFLRQRRRSPGGLVWRLWGATLAVAVAVWLLSVGQAVLSAAEALVGTSSAAERLLVSREPPLLADWAIGYGQDLDLSEAVLTRLERLPGVTAASPVNALPVAAVLRGGRALLGRDLEAEVLLQALPEALWPPALANGGLDPADASPVPVLLHPRLLSLYNAAVAPSLGLPALKAEALVGQGGELWLGRGRLAGRLAAAATPTRVPIVVAGLSPLAAPLGLTMPAAAARRLWQGIGQDGPLPARAAWLTVASGTDWPSLTRGLGRLDLVVDAQNERTMAALALARQGVRALAGLAFALLAASTVQAEASRRQQVAAARRTARIWGASPQRLRAVAASGAGLQAGLALALGLALAEGACRATLLAAARVAAPLGLDVRALFPSLHVDAGAALAAAGLSVAVAGLAAWAQRGSER